MREQLTPHQTGLAPELSAIGQLDGAAGPGSEPLFWPRAYPPLHPVPAEARRLAADARSRVRPSHSLDPTPGADFLEILERAVDPEDTAELCALFLGRVEDRLRPEQRLDARAQLRRDWQSSRVRRSISAEEALCSPAVVRFVKEMFNVYFRDDLYGLLRSEDTVILSSGSVDEERYGLPGPLLDCIRFALSRHWYGYSDSRGRDVTREAVARYESSRMRGAGYGQENIAVGMGGTVLIGAVADLIMSGYTGSGSALCGIPNYPPLVQSVSRRGNCRLVPVPERDGWASLQPMIDALTPDTPMVLVQTALNPTGARVSDDELGRLLDAAGPHTMIVLDECHEWLGFDGPVSAVRADPRLIRISSLSKNWSAPGLKVGWLIASASFVDDFYEYSSTTFGGPASIFYTLVEVLARMERWLIEGVEAVGHEQVAEFETSYQLDVAGLDCAYQRYAAERRQRSADLLALRDASCALLDAPGLRFLPPTCSINLAIMPRDTPDGYVYFRQLLADRGVSVFPGLLTMALSDGVARITTARSWTDLRAGIGAIADHAGGTT
ncbi:MAG TPA: pyridoxal phosphate-dependent aminotransferase [Jatrophihabitans sp.]|nr:pyridoxal phosphate-dependent aminotransferase [Jatrophihabitans sp.]